MARRGFQRPIVRRRKYVKPGRRRRIKIAQPPERPLKLDKYSLIRGELVQESPWWFTIHKRGITRPLVGADPLEARAVSEKSVRGFLHERIVYKYLVHRMRMIPEIDFTFQSSQFGGRLELGGIVVDFLFEYLRIAIRVQGPYHDRFFRQRKDDEQLEMLEDMGYRIEDIDIAEIADEFRFENRMRQIFNLATMGGGGMAAMLGIDEDVDDPALDGLVEIINGL